MEQATHPSVYPFVHVCILGRLSCTHRRAGAVERVLHERVEVEHLHEGPLPEEAAQRRRPALPDDLQPVDLDVAEQRLGERSRLGLQFGLLRRIRRDQLVL